MDIQALSSYHVKDGTKGSAMTCIVYKQAHSLLTQYVVVHEGLSEVWLLVPLLKTAFLSQVLNGFGSSKVGVPSCHHDLH